MSIKNCSKTSYSFDAYAGFILIRFQNLVLLSWFDQETFQTLTENKNWLSEHSPPRAGPGTENSKRTRFDVKTNNHFTRFLSF
jgi:hypothetical protein